LFGREGPPLQFYKDSREFRTADTPAHSLKLKFVVIAMLALSELVEPVKEQGCANSPTSPATPSGSEPSSTRRTEILLSGKCSTPFLCPGSKTNDRSTTALFLIANVFYQAAFRQ
jgi:hypothetical protein